MYEVKFLDELDFAILVAIKSGVDSCGYIATLTSRSQRVISGRVSTLSDQGLVVSEFSNQKHFHRSYKLTEKGLELITTSLNSVNYNLTLTALSKT